MRNEFTAIIERDGDGYIAYCPEVRESLVEAISLIREDRREDALHALPPRTRSVRRSRSDESSRA